MPPLPPSLFGARAPPLCEECADGSTCAAARVKDTHGRVRMLCRSCVRRARAGGGAAKRALTAQSSLADFGEGRLQRQRRFRRGAGLLTALGLLVACATAWLLGAGEYALTTVSSPSLTHDVLSTADAAPPPASMAPLLASTTAPTSSPSRAPSRSPTQPPAATAHPTPPLAWARDTPFDVNVLSDTNRTAANGTASPTARFILLTSAWEHFYNFMSAVEHLANAARELRALLVEPFVCHDAVAPPAVWGPPLCDTDGRHVRLSAIVDVSGAYGDAMATYGEYARAVPPVVSALADSTVARGELHVVDAFVHVQWSEPVVPVEQYDVDVHVRVCAHDAVARRPHGVHVLGSVVVGVHLCARAPSAPLPSKPWLEHVFAMARAARHNTTLMGALPGGVNALVASREQPLHLRRAPHVAMAAYADTQRPLAIVLRNYRKHLLRAPRTVYGSYSSLHTPAHAWLDASVRERFEGLNVSRALVAVHGRLIRVIDQLSRFDNGRVMGAAHDVCVREFVTEVHAFNARLHGMIAQRKSEQQQQASPRRARFDLVQWSAFDVDSAGERWSVSAGVRDEWHRLLATLPPVDVPLASPTPQWLAEHAQRLGVDGITLSGALDRAACAAAALFVTTHDTLALNELLDRRRMRTANATERAALHMAHAYGMRADGSRIMAGYDATTCTLLLPFPNSGSVFSQQLKALRLQDLPLPPDVADRLPCVADLRHVLRSAPVADIVQHCFH